MGIGLRVLRMMRMIPVPRTIFRTTSLTPWCEVTMGRPVTGMEWRWTVEIQTKKAGRRRDILRIFRTFRREAVLSIEP